MIPNEHAELARAVVDRWQYLRGKPAADVSSLAAFPILAAIYALEDGAEDALLYCFYEIARHRREPVHVPGEAAPREVLVFADFMIDSHEYGVDVVTGEVILVCNASYLVAPSLHAFFELYVAGETPM